MIEQSAGLVEVAEPVARDADAVAAVVGSVRALLWWCHRTLVLPMRSMYLAMDAEQRLGLDSLMNLMAGV